MSAFGVDVSCSKCFDCKCGGAFGATNAMGQTAYVNKLCALFSIARSLPIALLMLWPATQNGDLHFIFKLIRYWFFSCLWKQFECMRVNEQKCPRCSIDFVCFFFALSRLCSAYSISIEHTRNRKTFVQMYWIYFYLLINSYYFYASLSHIEQMYQIGGCNSTREINDTRSIDVLCELCFGFEQSKRNHNFLFFLLQNNEYQMPKISNKNQFHLIYAWSEEHFIRSSWRLLTIFVSIYSCCRAFFSSFFFVSEPNKCRNERSSFIAHWIARKNPAIDFY